MAAAEKVDPGINPIVEELGGITKFEQDWKAARFDKRNLQLAKPSKEDLRKRLIKLPIPDNVKSMLVRIREKEISREIGHLIRLLEGSEIEKDFAGTYLTNRDKFIRDKDNLVNRRILNVVNGENSDTQLWWTLTPFFLKQLREQQISPDQTMQLLKDWTLTHSSPRNINEVTLADLKELNSYIPSLHGEGFAMFVLGNNFGGPSYQFADKLAGSLLKHGSFFKQAIQEAQVSQSIR